jgi:hypothetical protein
VGSLYEPAYYQGVNHTNFQSAEPGPETVNSYSQSLPPHLLRDYSV